ncbi:MAG: 2-dehydro-3-deoxygalactonokinase [Oscillospiraceae bacterium]|jgi:2-dehydro-3-deoxygalactonokinase|nr:2-dehydro-3-deoxygalactonokinase [Oscillospiraceae bacterium]
MKEYIIAIDGGTTNTRASLWKDPGVCVDMVKSEVGVRITSIEGSNASLKNAVKGLLEQLLQNNSLSYDRIAGIYACGMITSKEGLAELPHLIAPAGMADFVRGLAKVELPDVAPLPIHFVRGLKNRDGGCLTLEEVEQMDVMRGEETETLALLDLFGNESGTLFALPGSHTKFVSVDADGNMIGCLSSLAGELLSAVTLNTILAGAVGKQFAGADYNREMLLAGYRTARDTSLARAAFSTRMLQMFIPSDEQDRASFLLGAVLENDVAAVKSSKALSVTRDMKLVIAGKEPLASALKLLFEEDGYFNKVEIYYPTQEKPMSGYGLYQIAKANS